LEPGGVVELPPDEAKHVHNVLRGGNGDYIEVVDGVGKLFAARLRGGREAAVTEELAAHGGAGVEISLYQAVPKGGRMDIVVEKATEVGATRIVPLLA
jgi:16S rRNA (uracil1498-N3)-methyltransferase